MAQPRPRPETAPPRAVYDLKIETADDTLTAASSVSDFTVASWLANHWMNGARRGV